MDQAADHQQHANDIGRALCSLAPAPVRDECGRHRSQREHCVTDLLSSFDDDTSRSAVTMGSRAARCGVASRRATDHASLQIDVTNVTGRLNVITSRGCFQVPPSVLLAAPRCAFTSISNPARSVVCSYGIGRPCRPSRHFQGSRTGSSWATRHSTAKRFCSIARNWHVVCVRRRTLRTSFSYGAFVFSQTTNF